MLMVGKVKRQKLGMRHRMFRDRKRRDLMNLSTMQNMETWQQTGAKNVEIKEKNESVIRASVEVKGLQGDEEQWRKNE
jgi:hypothetical protein